MFEFWMTLYRARMVDVYLMYVGPASFLKDHLTVIEGIPNIPGC